MYGLALYIFILMLYPYYLVVSFGVADICAARFVVVALIMKVWLEKTSVTKFKWNRLDSWVTAYILVGFVIMSITDPSHVLENRLGNLMDTWLVYMIFRIFITDFDKMSTFIKLICIPVTFTAILGIIESCTSWQPYVPFRQFCPWFDMAYNIEPRHGFMRAIGSFGHPIMFGMSFGIFCPLIFALRHSKNGWRYMAYVFTAMAILGAMSSMSNGGWVMIILVIFCLFLERAKHFVKPLIWLFTGFCIFTQIASNRNFYHVLASYAALLSGSGWHRARLIDCAIEHFYEWYLVGYKGEDPGWGENLGMGMTDITNEFILAGVKFGVLGVITLCGIFIVAFQQLIFSYKSSSDPVFRSWIWATGTLLIALATTFMSVSIFGQVVPLFFCSLGIVGSIRNMAETTSVLLQKRALNNNTHGL